MYVIVYFIILVFHLTLKKLKQLRILKKHQISYFGLASLLEIPLFFILELNIGDDSSVTKKIAMLNRMIFLYFRFFLVNKLIIIKKTQIISITVMYVANIFIYYFLNEQTLDFNNILSLFFGLISIALIFFIMKLTNIEEVHSFFFEILKNLNQSFFVIKEGKINKLICLEGEILQSFCDKKLLSPNGKSNISFLNEIFLVEKKDLSENYKNLDFDATAIIENEDYVRLDFEKYFFDNNKMKNEKQIIKLNVKLRQDLKNSYVLFIKRFSIKRQDYFIFIINQFHQKKDPNDSIIKFYSSKLSKINDYLNELIPLIELLSFSEKKGDNKNNPFKLALTNLKFTITKVDNLIYYEQIKAENVILSQSKIRIYGFIEELIRTVRPLAHNRKIQLKIAIEECLLNLEIQTDPAILRQIILNLFSNAIKFTIDHGVINLTVTQDDENQSKINFVFMHSGVEYNEKQLEDLYLILHKSKDNFFEEKNNFNFFNLYITNSLLSILNENQSLKIECLSKQETKITFSLEFFHLIEYNISELNKSHSYLIEEESKKIIEDENKKIGSFKNSYLSEEENKKQLSSLKISSFVESNSSNFLSPLPFLDKNLKRNSEGESFLNNFTSSTKLDSFCKFKQNSSSLIKDINIQSCILNMCDCRQCLLFDYDSLAVLPLKFIFNSLKITCSIVSSNNYETINKVLTQRDCSDIDCQSLKLILINCHSPIQESIVKIKQLKQALEENNMKVPIIGTMSLIDKEEMVKCSDAGLNDFIFSPFTINAIKSCLIKLPNPII